MNPIKQARIERGMTQRELAVFAGMTPHALLRYEQGLYEQISPNLLSCLEWEFNIKPEDLKADYAKFRHDQQIACAEHMQHPPRIQITAEKHPFTLFREGITRRAVGKDTRIGFCILLAINPAVVLNYDSGKQATMPHLIKDALLNAGLDEGYLKMLDNYGQIWFERYGC